MSEMESQTAGIVLPHLDHGFRAMARCAFRDLFIFARRLRAPPMDDQQQRQPGDECDCQKQRHLMRKMDLVRESQSQLRAELSEAVRMLGESGCNSFLDVARALVLVMST